jgi:hypothetical protein
MDCPWAGRHHPVRHLDSTGLDVTFIQVDLLRGQAVFF